MTQANTQPKPRNPRNPRNPRRRAPVALCPECGMELCIHGPQGRECVCGWVERGERATEGQA